MKISKHCMLSFLVILGVSSYGYADHVTLSVLNYGTEPATVTFECATIPILCNCSKPVVFTEVQPGETRSTEIEGAYCCFLPKLQAGNASITLSSELKCVNHKINITLTQDANDNWHAAFQTD